MAYSRTSYRRRYDTRARTYNKKSSYRGPVSYFRTGGYLPRMGSVGFRRKISYSPGYKKRYANRAGMKTKKYTKDKEFTVITSRSVDKVSLVDRSLAMLT